MSVIHREQIQTYLTICTSDTIMSLHSTWMNLLQAICYRFLKLESLPINCGKWRIDLPIFCSLFLFVHQFIHSSPDQTEQKPNIRFSRFFLGSIQPSRSYRDPMQSYWNLPCRYHINILMKYATSDNSQSRI